MQIEIETLVEVYREEIDKLMQEIVMLKATLKQMEKEKENLGNNQGE